MAAMIQIVGGGLAGLSLGTALAKRGIPVSLAEAGRYPRHRVCGEFISGVSAETLEAIGIGRCLDDGERLETMIWCEEGRVCHRGKLPRPAIGISRWLLDSRLRDVATTAGCGVREKQSIPPPESGDGIVWCAGRKKSPSRLVGLKSHFRDFELEADLEMHMGRGGYAGISRVEGGAVNVCGLFRAEAAAGRHDRPLERALRASGLARLADRLASARPVDGSACAVSGFTCGWQPCGGGGVMTAGDAVAMIPPFTGNGMSMAFESAECLLPALTAYSEGRTGWKEACGLARRAQVRRFRKRMTLAAILHPFLMENPGRKTIAILARARMVPVDWLFSQLRT